ncbi:MAG: HD domain-containing protein [Acidobacteria bacterium]|nr:HD domain-containing protein [Acidobacteriota bacterium]MBI3663732.1 HD domain-containing protein [Acidobacteriota bacterium]
MKSDFVAELQAEQSVTSFFLITVKEVRTGQKSGKPYLQLELRDRTGSIDARVFQNIESVAETVRVNEIVKVKGRVDLWQGKKQLVIEQIRAAKADEYELGDFLPHTKRDVEELFAELRECVARVGNPWIQRLLEDVVNDPGVALRLKRAPAGKTMHHAYIGGLLEHIVSLCGLCQRVAPHYPEIDGDLLLCGAILHDIGKLDELLYERSFGYTTEGQLLGHIVLGLQLLEKKMDAIEGFPSDLRTLIQHLVLSHHGREEFGSPKLPAFPEALMLHYLDDLDSKLAAMRESFEAEKGETEWTAKNWSLQRPLLRLDRFRQREESGGKTSAASAKNDDSPVD